MQFSFLQITFRNFDSSLVHGVAGLVLSIAHYSGSSQIALLPVPMLINSDSLSLQMGNWPTSRSLTTQDKTAINNVRSLNVTSTIMICRPDFRPDQRIACLSWRRHYRLSLTSPAVCKIVERLKYPNSETEDVVSTHLTSSFWLFAIFFNGHTSLSSTFL